MLANTVRQAAVFFVALVLCLSWSGTASAQFGGAGTKKTVTTFASKGQNIRLWTYEPAKAGKYPLLILLHGIEGLEGLDKYAGKYDMVARGVAAEGYIVYMVHYFDRTLRLNDDLKKLETSIKTMLVGPDNAPQVEEIRNDFQQWMGTVGDAVQFGRRQPNVDGQRVALVGFSLGGFLATSTAVMDSKLGVDAVVEFFGGLPRELYTKLDKMPPTLIFHGDKDTIVPVKEAHDLQTALKAKTNHVEHKVYEGVGHMFLGDNEQFRLDIALDAQRRTLAFLAKQLGKKKS